MLLYILHCLVAVPTDILSVPDASQQILNLNMHLLVPQLNFFSNQLYLHEFRWLSGKLNKKANPSSSYVSIYSNNDISRYAFRTNILYLFRLISQYTNKPIYRDSPTKQSNVCNARVHKFRTLTSAIVHITRIHSLMTLPVLFWRKEKELFCTVSKKKK